MGPHQPIRASFTWAGQGAAACTAIFSDDRSNQLALTPLACASLRPLSLVIESSGSRVMRYSQNVQRVLKVPSEAVALLATLMLRGPQTAAELRLNCERLHRFADISSVEGL